MAHLRRREFVAGLGGATIWPHLGRAQGEQKRRMGILMGFAESDAEWQSRLAAMQAALSGLGWTAGRNIQIDYRWATAGRDRLGNFPAELLALAPDLIFASPHYAIKGVYERTRAIPIVGVQSGDFVTAGFAQSHARPGGNVTGFTLFEVTISTKYLQLLKEIAPQTARVCVMQSNSSSWRGDFNAIRAAAPSLGLEAVAAVVEDARQIQRAVMEFAGIPKTGFIIPPDSITERHRELIVQVLASHNLPAIYPNREFVTAGGLMSYGTDFADIFRRAASYVDRILRGAKPSELPVQAPVKFDLILNMKTAKALGLDVPLQLQQRADEVIE